MKTLPYALVMNILLLCGVHPVFAQWQRLPMKNVAGNINATAHLTSSEGTLFYSDPLNDAPYYYDEALHKWQVIGLETMGIRPDAVAKAGNYVYAANFIGVWASHLENDTFELKRNFLPSTIGSGIFQFAPRGFTGEISGLSLYAIHHFKNNGDAYSEISLPSSSGHGHSITWHKDRLFCVTDSGLYHTDDEGQHWTLNSRQLYEPGFRSYTTKLVEHVLTIYLVSDSIFYSNDKGEHWQLSNDSLSWFAFANTATLYSDTLFVVSTDKGILYSVDHGSTFSVYNNSTTLVQQPTTIGVSGNGLYALIPSKGIFRYVNGSWQNEMFGISEPRIQAMTKMGDKLITACLGVKGAGLFVSEDNGDNWIPLNTPADAELTYNAGMINTNGRLIIAGNHYSDSFTVYSNGIYYSDDTAQTWHHADMTAIPKWRNYSFSELIAYKNVIIATSTDQNLYSEDNGTSWNIINSLGSEVWGHTEKEDTLYVICSGSLSPRFAYSTDGKVFTEVLCTVGNFSRLHDVAYFNNAFFVARSSNNYVGPPELLGLFKTDPHHCENYVHVFDEGIFEPGVDETGVVGDLMYVVHHGRQFISFSLDGEIWERVTGGLNSTAGRFALANVKLLGDYIYADRFRISWAEVKAQFPTGLASVKQKPVIEVYPNPVTAYEVNIHCDSRTVKEITLTGITGQTIPIETVKKTEGYAVSLPPYLKTGIYILKVDTETIKLVVQEN
jgi:hypothetical protein